MLTLIDGPCAGTFMVKRAPVFLRAVIKTQLDGKGETDVLDQLDDTPAADEQVFIYQIQGRAGVVHLHARGKDGKSIGGWYAMGTYKHLPDVEGERFRDNEQWRAWVTTQVLTIMTGMTLASDGTITPKAQE